MTHEAQQPKSFANTARSRASSACTASRSTASTSGSPSGDKLNALDPASGKTVRSLDVAGACGHRVRRQAPVPDRRGPHPEDRPGDRPVLATHPGARQRRRLRARLGRRLAVGRPVPRAQDPPGRSRDRRDPAHHRVQPLRHRRDLGRRRALARHLGRRRERAAPHRSADGRGARAARDAGRASACRASNPTAPTVLLRRRQQRQGQSRPPPQARAAPLAITRRAPPPRPHLSRRLLATDPREAAAQHDAWVFAGVAAQGCAASSPRDGVLASPGRHLRVMLRHRLR